jgi:hypothetical protein
MSVFTASAQSNPGNGQRRFATFEVEVVTLTEKGFEPSRIVRPPGEFRLVLRNFRPEKVSDFEILDDRGAKKKDLQDNKDKAKQIHEQLDLGPGTYMLRLRNQPSTRIQIVIDPNKR